MCRLRAAHDYFPGDCLRALRARMVPIAPTAAIATNTPTTGHAPLSPVPLVGATTAGVPRVVAEPNAGVTARGVLVAVVGGRDVGEGIGVSVGGAVGVGGASVAEIAVTPAAAVSAAAVFVGPMGGACAMMICVALIPVARRIAAIPMSGMMMATLILIARVCSMPPSLR